ncbi:MAG TPA: SLBB domain-containing protein, partial [Thermoguttaceae bacterium]|nr:SLBB domain-containing protein [Thermoguttaceae bacterium]
RSSSYLLAAITAAGGLAEDAGTQITIQRPASSEGNVRLTSYSDSATPVADNQPTLVTLNLAEAITQTGPGEYLPSGTTVRVEQRNPAPIEVVGLVKRPGQYDFPVNHDLRVFGAIALGGGVSSQLADKVLVMRYQPETGELVTIDLSLYSAKRNTDENLLLAPGDIVSVEQTPATVVAGIITNVIRFGVGMSTNLPIF